MNPNEYIVRVTRRRGTESESVVTNYEIQEAQNATEAAEVIEKAMETRNASHTSTVADLVEYIGSNFEALTRRIPEITKDACAAALKDAGLEFDGSNTTTLEECVSDIILDDDALADKIADRVAMRIAGGAAASEAMEIKRTGFAAAAHAIRTGDAIYGIGDEITTHHDKFGEIVWRVIDTAAYAPYSITVQVVKVITHRCFSQPGKRHPWGSNDWANSDLRAWLNGEFFESFSDDDRAEIRPITKRTYSSASKQIEETEDWIFILSASELGFKVDDDWIRDEGPAYDFYAGAEDEDDQRAMVDMDGDEVVWWTRSPYPYSAYYVRFVGSSGALYNGSAYNGSGVAPACVIS